MDIKEYKTAKSSNYNYTFISKSAKKSIFKAVVFQFIEDDIYNIALLDFVPKTKTWDDMAKSNNGDLPQIIATIWACMIDFMKNNPKVLIAITGNTPSKTRFYNRIF